MSKTHYILMGGIDGCLPSHCDAYQTTQSAAEAAGQIYEWTKWRIGRFRNLRYMDGKHVPGNDYVEIVECECDKPWVHSVSSDDLDIVEWVAWMYGYEAGKGSAHDYIPSWMVIPELYATENVKDPMAIVKLFTPDSNWTWYITEYQPETKMAFGLVDGLEKELGYISIAELEQVKGPVGLKIERDLWFRPQPLSELR